MASFNRKSMEEIVQRMVFWSRGTSQKFTDFRVGSRIRTLYEAVALVTEELYDKVYRAIKTQIEVNVYATMGFDKQQATAATGLVTFSRTTPADTAYLIPSGTLLQTKATATTAPITFRTTADAIIAQGGMAASVMVICQTPGTIGNTEAATITTFVTKPTGIDAVTNPVTFTTGQDEETPDEQKSRFQRFITSLSRGTLGSIEYGATTAVVYDAGGQAIERIRDARAFEFLPERKGEVDLYVWNGVGPASEAMLAAVKRQVYGYYDAAGSPVYGYKAAGIQVNTMSTTASPVYVRILLTPEDGVTLADLKSYIEYEVGSFFSALRQGGTLVQTALETRVKLIDGIYDVKIALSINGTDYTYENITAGSTEIFIPSTPYEYVVS